MGAVATVEKHAGGRPLKFKSIKELQSKIDAYFESCYEIDAETGKRQQIEPFTITGLALELDTSRETLMEIEIQRSGYGAEFVDAIKRAKLKCHNYAEKQLYTAKSAQGAIFALKNYGWKDTQSVELSGANGGPLLVQDVSALSDADLERLIEIAEKLQIQGEIIDITPDNEESN